MTATSQTKPAKTERRPYVRDTEANRRQALISAAQTLVAEGGQTAATVRAIAERAGVTPGLIRHYFGSKEQLLQSAYVELMDGMTETGEQAEEDLGPEPEARLAAFVAASLRPPVVDPRSVGLWAGYLHRVQADPDMLDRHESSYLRYRNALAKLITALPRAATEEQIYREAIACNAVIDGLWLEGSVLMDRFPPGLIVSLGLSSVGAILGVDLARYNEAALALAPSESRLGFITAPETRGA